MNRPLVVNIVTVITKSRVTSVHRKFLGRKQEKKKEDKKNLKTGVSEEKVTIQYSQVEINPE